MDVKPHCTGSGTSNWGTALTTVGMGAIEALEHGRLAERIVNAFNGGLAIPLGQESAWWAELRAIHDGEHRVETQISLLPIRPLEALDVERLANAPGNPEAPAEARNGAIELHYTFMPLFTLSTNLTLFKEYSAKEIARLALPHVPG